jgi:hypothetical protein
MLALKILLTLPIFLAPLVNTALATPSEDSSTHIEDGMTVEQVASAIGFRPNTVEEKTCGNDDTIPFWFCRVQTYADGAHTLIVYFRKSDDGSPWRVHSWFVR